MGFWKYTPFLALGILVLYQAGVLQAVPFRAILESRPETAPITEDDMCLLLAAVVEDYVQRKISELEQVQEAEDANIIVQKRGCNTATCVTHKLADLLSRSGGMVKGNFVPTYVGSKAFGRRRRDVQE